MSWRSLSVLLDGRGAAALHLSCCMRALPRWLSLDELRGWIGPRPFANATAPPCTLLSEQGGYAVGNSEMEPAYLLAGPERECESSVTVDCVFV